MCRIDRYRYRLFKLVLRFVSPRFIYRDLYVGVLPYCQNINIRNGPKIAQKAKKNLRIKLTISGNVALYLQMFSKYFGSRIESQKSYGRIEKIP